jgi:hypothetical protein
MFEARSLRPLVFLAIGLWLAGAALAEQLYVSAGRVAGNGTNSAIYMYDGDDGYSGPIIPPTRMPGYPLDSFTTTNDFVTGGYGCPLNYAGGDFGGLAIGVEQCLGGVCASDSILSFAHADTAVRQLAADNRYVIGCAGSSVVPPNEVLCSRFDTQTGAVQNIRIDLPRYPIGVPAGSLPDVHAIGRNGNNWDIVLRHVAGGVSSGQVVRINNQGSIVADFLVPFPFFPIGGDWAGGSFYMVEGSANGPGFGIAQYNANNYTRVKQLVNPGVLSTNRSFAAVGDELLATKPNGELWRFAMSDGAEIGMIPLPPGEAFFLAFAEVTCQEDNTKLRFGNNLAFEASGTWTNFQGQTLPIRFLPRVGRDSILAYFSDPNNVEFLIKALDGCALTQAYWALGAAATTVGWRLEIKHVATGQKVVFTNKTGKNSVAFADVEKLTNACAK